MNLTLIALIASIVVFLVAYLLCQYAIKGNTEADKDKTLFHFKACIYFIIAISTLFFIMIGEEEITIVSISVVIVSILEMLSNYKEYKKKKRNQNEG